jgi:hypothetical protein
MLNSGGFHERMIPQVPTKKAALAVIGGNALDDQLRQAA